MAVIFFMPDGVCNPVRNVKFCVSELTSTSRTGLQTPSGREYYAGRGCSRSHAEQRNACMDAPRPATKL
jgi:hypothetical protein